MTSSAAWKLAFGLLAIIVVLILAGGTRRTIAIGTVLVIIPFQFVETQYATSSVLIAYALAAILLVGGSLKLRMIPETLAIVFAYCASLALADRELLSRHAIFMFQFFSSLAVFLLGYNYARYVKSVRSVISVLLTINVLVVGYCALQLLAGPGERFTPFGIQEFQFNSNRDPNDPRLVGPFSNPGSTAGYFTLMLLICAVEMVHALGARRRLVQALVCVNLLGLVATGNRTGFLILVAAFPAFLFVFRETLGARTIGRYVVGGIVALVLASTAAVVLTDFGRMFERLANVTQTEEGVPSTRSETWPIAVEKIKEEPWFGEGPHFLTAENVEVSGERTLQVEFDESGEVTSAVDPYPHSLYLYLLRTVGTVGLLAVMWFFLRIWLTLGKQLKSGNLAKDEATIVRLGLLLIPAFLVAQITLEFNRPTTMDYAHFVFALLGLLVGTGDRKGGVVIDRLDSSVLSQEGSRQ